MLVFVLLVSFLSVLIYVFLGAIYTRYNPKNFDQMHSGLFLTISEAVNEKHSRVQCAFDLAYSLQRVPGIQISHNKPIRILGSDQGIAVYTRDISFSPASSEIKSSTMASL